ncbi:MAG: hypothetical protein GY801_45835, partial [bacterium]|nr:hypothetical protein [bacterium]
MSVLHPLSTIHDFPPSEGWPGAEQELLLQAALLNSSTAVGAWNQWLSRIDLHKLGAASRSFLPFVHKNLQEYDDVIDTAISRYIKTVHLEIYARNRKLFTQIA